MGQDAESVLILADAKEIISGRAKPQAEENRRGVKETDNVLDKYIKQHRDEMEAHKFDTIVKEEGNVSWGRGKQPLETTESIPISKETSKESVHVAEAGQKEGASTAFLIQFLGNVRQN